MQKNGLQRRAIGALTVVALSLFLGLCLFNFGQVAATEATSPEGFHLVIAGWFVEVFGAGAYVAVVLPFVWGLVVYFREDTPSLTMRAVGTLLLATSIAMISGLLQTDDPGLWAGALGSYTVQLTNGLGGLIGTYVANALAWLGTLTLCFVSAIWATDWMFHSLRKGDMQFSASARPPLQTEPVNADLREPDEAPDEREFVRMESAGADAAAAMTEPVAVTTPIEVQRVPEGFSADERGERVMVRGPAGYEGVEFLPPSDELAGEARRAPEYVESEAISAILDDEISFAAVAAEATEQDADELASSELSPSEPSSSEPSSSEPSSSEPMAETVTSEVVIDVLPAAPYTPSTSEEVAAEAERHEPAPETVDQFGVDAQVDSASSMERSEAERPRSGIGIPEDSPFVDEFFVMSNAVHDVPAGDGAAQHDDMETLFTDPAPAAESPESMPEPAAEEPSFEAPESAPADGELPFADPPAMEGAAIQEEEVATDPVIVDEVLFAPAAFALIDDVIDEEIPPAIAARSAPPAETPRAVEADAPTAATESGAGPDLAKLSGMLLDPLFYDAVSAVIERGRASGMVLQRSFGVGHARGLRLLEQMEAAGIVGAEDANGSRDLFVTREAWEAFTGTRTA